MAIPFLIFLESTDPKIPRSQMGVLFSTLHHWVQRRNAEQLGFFGPDETGLRSDETGENAPAFVG